MMWHFLDRKNTVSWHLGVLIIKKKYIRSWTLSNTGNEKVVEVSGRLPLRGMVSQQRHLMVVEIVHLVVLLHVLENIQDQWCNKKRIIKTSECAVDAHLSGSMDAKFEATADNIKTEADESMQHALNKSKYTQTQSLWSCLSVRYL